MGASPRRQGREAGRRNSRFRAGPRASRRPLARRSAHARDYSVRTVLGRLPRRPCPERHYTSRPRTQHRLQSRRLQMLMDRINTWNPLFTAAIISSGSFGPPEGSGVGVVLGRKRLMAACSSTIGSEHAALEPPLGQRGEEALDRIEPRGGGGREVERPTRMPAQPCADLRMLVGGVVVGDGVDQLAGWHGRPRWH